MGGGGGEEKGGKGCGVCVCGGRGGCGGQSRQSLSTVSASFRKCLQPLQPSSDQFLPVSVSTSVSTWPAPPPSHERD